NGESQVDDIWIEPAEFNPGDEVKLCARIKNIGDADAVGKFWWNRYIDDTFINQWYKDGLAAGNNKRTYKKYIWPTDCKLHTIKVVVDADGNITESDEYNNERSERFSATPPLLQLVHNLNTGGDFPTIQAAIDDSPLMKRFEHYF
ncbi:MAG: hypothetical protein KAT65_14330, partial [Methanophagales archaeon]|nr:hypothetical protein [Methanophagales archaeon]